MRRSRVKNTVTHAVLVVASLLAIFPLFWVALASFKNNRDVIDPVTQAFDFVPTAANYVSLFGTPAFVGSALTSVLITVISTLVVVALATLGGYAFARLRFPGRRLLALVMVIVQIIPGIVLIVPLYRLVSGIGLYDQWLPIAVIMAGLTLPFATWLMLAFFQNAPLEIEEAALVDGATRFQLFRHVLIPMVAPGMATAGIFTAIAVWNSFLIPVVLGQSNAETLTVYVAQFVTFQDVNWGPLCATAVLILAPIVLFVLSMQRSLVKGLTAGSLK
ncbi:MAG TPA: carbohydrate ABC transporter permease [Pseudolysinimonas sp.]|jgi:multiple sugar transport system permease protein